MLLAENCSEQRRKQEEKARKKAEVRKRLEESTKSKKSKKGGFMTPERKKKLRTLLRKKAAEELKREQERKAEERKKMITERCGQKKDVENANEATLQAICKEYYKRIAQLEDAKYDLEYEVSQKEFLIHELAIQVNDLRGKFVKPNLKKVSKYEGKFEKLKMIAKTSEIDFRANLKNVKSNKFKLEGEEEGKKQAPEWANK
ncbi:Troponin I [Araneus ventricosus]|uniref:Troponin I n=1 Tax=Araneus ventricosus TaxID=182803 RepID=A0A4Y2D0N7_ARAVE|nr:Troponin I [Araneus ventricosus]